MKLGSYAFSKCTGLRSIALPEGLDTIGENCFEESGLTEVHMASSVSVICSRAFSDCSDLKCITLPAGIETIEDGCFQRSGLVEIAIPRGVTQIKSGAFCECRALKKAQLPRGVEALWDRCFEGAALAEIEIPNSVTAIKCAAFRKCSSLSKVTFVEGMKLKELGQSAFRGCGSMAVRLPDGLEVIPESCFAESGIVEVHIPASVRKIQCSHYSGVFSDCRSLKAVTFAAGSTLAEIGDRAFWNCAKLRDIAIPQSVTYVGTECFRNSGVRKKTLPFHVKQGENVFNDEPEYSFDFDYDVKFDTHFLDFL